MRVRARSSSHGVEELTFVRSKFSRYAGFNSYHVNVRACLRAYLFPRFHRRFLKDRGFGTCE